MNKNRRTMTIGLGVPTILVIFVVLGMVILSLLTYLKAVQNEKSVEREIEYVTSYYEADIKGKEVIDCIRKGKDIPYPYTMEEDSYVFSFEMTNNQELYVKINNDIVESYRVKEK